MGQVAYNKTFWVLSSLCLGLFVCLSLCLSVSLSLSQRNAHIWRPTFLLHFFYCRWKNLKSATVVTETFFCSLCLCGFRVQLFKLGSLCTCVSVSPVGTFSIQPQTFVFRHNHRHASRIFSLSLGTNIDSSAFGCLSSFYRSAHFFSCDLLSVSRTIYYVCLLSVSRTIVSCLSPVSVTYGCIMSVTCLSRTFVLFF